VVATLRSGALLLSRQGKLQRVLNEKSGLTSDSVTFAYPDKEGGLWLALVSGVSRVQDAGARSHSSTIERD